MFVWSATIMGPVCFSYLKAAPSRAICPIAPGSNPAFRFSPPFDICRAIRHTLVAFSFWKSLSRSITHSSRRKLLSRRRFTTPTLMPMEVSAWTF
jgi:hypothetical protein